MGSGILERSKTPPKNPIPGASLYKFADEENGLGKKGNDGETEKGKKLMIKEDVYV